MFLLRSASNKFACTCDSTQWLLGWQTKQRDAAAVTGKHKVATFSERFQSNQKVAFTTECLSKWCCGLWWVAFVASHRTVHTTRSAGGATRLLEKSGHKVIKSKKPKRSKESIDRELQPRSRCVHFFLHFSRHTSFLFVPMWHLWDESA